MTVIESIKEFFTTRRCRLCHPVGSLYEPNLIPKPSPDADTQTKFSYELSICDDCTWKLRAVLVTETSRQNGR